MRQRSMFILADVKKKLSCRKLMGRREVECRWLQWQGIEHGIIDWQTCTSLRKRKKNKIHGLIIPLSTYLCDIAAFACYQLILIPNMSAPRRFFLPVCWLGSLVVILMSFSLHNKIDNCFLCYFLLLFEKEYGILVGRIRKAHSVISWDVFQSVLPTFFGKLD